MKIVIILEFNVNGILVDGVMVNNIVIGVINGVEFVMFSLSFFNFMQ